MGADERRTGRGAVDAPAVLEEVAAWGRGLGALHARIAELPKQAARAKAAAARANLLARPKANIVRPDGILEDMAEALLHRKPLPSWPLPKNRDNMP